MAVQAAQVEVGDEATALNAATTGGTRLLVRNSDDTNSVFLGAADVAVGDGFELGSTDTVEVTLMGTERLYAVAEAETTVDVHVLRTGA